MFCECFVQNVAGFGLPHRHQPAAAAEQPPEDAQAGKQVGPTVILCWIGFVVVLLYKKVWGGGGYISIILPVVHSVLTVSSEPLNIFWVKALCQLKCL